MKSVILSSGRSLICKAQGLLPDAEIIVPEDEEQDYRDRFGDRVVGHQFGECLSSVKNYAIQRYGVPLLIVDDMVSGFCVPQYPGMPVPIDAEFAVKEIESLARGLSAYGHYAFGLSSSRVKGSIFRPIRFGSDIDKHCIVILDQEVKFNEDLSLLENVWLSASNLEKVSCVDYIQASKSSTSVGGRSALRKRLISKEREYIRSKFPGTVDILRSSIR